MSGSTKVTLSNQTNKVIINQQPITVVKTSPTYSPTPINSGGGTSSSNVYYTNYVTLPNTALTVNTGLFLHAIGNSTVIIGANSASITAPGIVRLNDTLSSANTQQAATANVANALNTLIQSIAIASSNSITGQLAFNEANSFQSIINSAYSQANSATNSAQAAYNKANTGGSSSSANNVIIYGTANSQGMMSQFAYANGNFANTGDASYATFLLRNQSNGNTVNLSLNGSNTISTSFSSINQIVLGSNNYLYSFKGQISARDINTNNAKIWSIEGGIKRGLGPQTTTYIGSPIINIIAADNGTNNWSINLNIDSVNAAMLIQATGSTNTTNWVSRIDVVEIG